MAITQVNLKTQAKDASLTPSKISTTNTDDFSFPRDVSASRDVRVSTDNRVIFGNSDKAWMKYSTANSTILGRSDDGGEGELQIASLGELDFYSNTAAGGVEGAGTWNPGIEMYATGNIWIRNDGTPQGLAGDRYVGIHFDDDAASGFHSIVRLNRGNNDNADFLELGYDADGTSRTGARVKGANLTVESPGTPLSLVASRVNASGADFAVDSDKKIILGNSDNAWIKYDSTVGGISILSQSGVAQLSTDGTQLILAVDGANTFNPSIALDHNVNYIQFVTTGSTPDVEIHNDGSLHMKTTVIDMENHKIINLTDPTSAQDAATKNYVDAQIATVNGEFVIRETPSGTVDGSNAVFTLANTPQADKEMVFLNGMLQDPGAGNDYTISGATITFASAPASGSKIRVSYIK